MKNSLVRIEASGSNCNKLISISALNNLALFDICKADNKVYFSISESQLKILKKNIPSGCVIKIMHMGFWTSLKNLFIKRIGLVIGGIISIALLIIISNTLLNIEILGNENIESSKIMEVLRENGIIRYKQMNYDTEYVEGVLSRNFNFSMVSAITKGNSLIISIKEEIPEESIEFPPIVADYNMIIESINVYSGTAKVKDGDVVYAGDVLVEGYIMDSEEKITIKPSAEIKAVTFFSDSYVFNNVELLKQRTGKSVVINNSLKLGDITILNTQKDCEFEKYEVEKFCDQTGYYFLPFNVEKTVCYELQDIENSRNFEEEKEAIVDNLKKSAYALVPNHLVVENENLQISETNFGYIVTIYLKSSVYLRYNQ